MSKKRAWSLGEMRPAPSAVLRAAHLRDQLSRAASSIALNCAEARGKNSLKDQLRFFRIAMGSTRESQAVLILADLEGSAIWITLDRLAASLYRLIERAR